MNEELKIELRFFGAFRKHGQSLQFAVPMGCDIAGVKAALLGALHGQDEALIGDSVLADDVSILPSDHVFTVGGALSILPPVCGG
ncbi:MAG: hypothetical protein H6865_04175 [Rhodospirillales bacterium]|nr:hypothetical protein [Alphaproteobacteria bacterium]MCB9986814.1 hypothetical protein [Rhodospirillales bacterium]USO08421.1 MAG: hypothetical protein H6866_04205 [Rhodospirillales bacterium]